MVSGDKVPSDDGRVWHVWSYPSEACLHTTTTYEAAERWRQENDTVSFIAPSWPREDKP